MGNYPLKQVRGKEKSGRPVKDKLNIDLLEKELKTKLKNALIESHIVSQHNEVQNFFFQNSVSKLDSTIESDHSVNSLNNSHLKDEKFKAGNPSSLRERYFFELSKKYFFTKNIYEDQPTQTVSIFDWDDTFMCTSYISPYGFLSFLNIRDSIDTKDLQILSELEDKIIEILELAISLGHTYIVTNAADKWVEYSANALFPKLIKTLKNVVIISARSWFHSVYPGNSKMWKISTFNLISSIYPTEKFINLIALGDSFSEMEASYHFAMRFKNHFIKTIKLKDSPSAFQLVKELKIIYTDLPFIYNAQTSIAISVKKDSYKAAKTIQDTQTKEVYFNFTYNISEQSVSRNTIS